MLVGGWLKAVAVQAMPYCSAVLYHLYHLFYCLSLGRSLQTPFAGASYRWVDDGGVFVGQSYRPQHRRTRTETLTHGVAVEFCFIQIGK